MTRESRVTRMVRDTKSAPERRLNLGSAGMSSLPPDPSPPFSVFSPFLSPDRKTKYALKDVGREQLDELSTYVLTFSAKLRSPPSPFSFSSYKEII